MQKENSFVAIFKTHAEAEDAVKALQHSGFDMRKLSIVAHDYNTEEHVVGYYNAGERIRYWGKQGVFWGGLWGLLFGSAFFWVPGIGPLVVAGPLAGWIVAALETAALGGGMGIVGAALASIGIPTDSILEYETALTAGKFVLIAKDTPAEITRAQDIIQGARPEMSKLHNLAPSLLNHKTFNAPFEGMRHVIPACRGNQYSSNYYNLY